MKAFASDKTVRLGAEGLVLWAEVVVLVLVPVY